MMGRITLSTRLSMETLTKITYNFASNEIVLTSSERNTKTIQCDSDEEMERLVKVSRSMAEGADVLQFDLVRF